MIQFNLLPDVKLEYIKARRTKRTVIAIAVVTSATSLTILVLLFLIVGVVQKQHMNNLSADIDKKSDTLKKVEGLDKILTVQNQLNSLPDLHKDKPATSRLFKFVQQVTPVQATIAELKLDVTNSTLIISGSADSLGTINKYIDTLKFTDLKVPEKAAERAFSEVVLTSFGRNEEKATYQIDMKFNPIIFDSLQEVSLVVPSIITTRSTIEKPGTVFEPLNNPGVSR